MSEGRVYFVLCEKAGALKIGFSTDLGTRLSDLRVGNPLEIVLLGSVPGDEALEHGLHARFGALHIRGEWFRATPDLLEFVSDLTSSRRVFTVEFAQDATAASGPAALLSCEFRGETRTLHDWCSQLYLDTASVLSSLLSNASIEEAFADPENRRGFRGIRRRRDHFAERTRPNCGGAA